MQGHAVADQSGVVQGRSIVQIPVAHHLQQGPLGVPHQVTVPVGFALGPGGGGGGIAQEAQVAGVQPLSRQAAVEHEHIPGEYHVLGH